MDWEHTLALVLGSWIALIPFFLLMQRDLRKMQKAGLKNMNEIHDIYGRMCKDLIDEFNKERMDSGRIYFHIQERVTILEKQIKEIKGGK